MRLLYVVSLFPCWSETFIAREITALVAAGVDVRILSLKAPHEKLVQPDAAKLLSRTRHPLSRPRAAFARTRAFFVHTTAVSRAMAHLVRRMARRPKEAAKSIEAVGRALEHLDWIRDFDPDLIHAHWGTYPSTVAWMLSRVLDKPFGLTCHAHDIFVNDHLLREKIESARVPVTISRFNVDYLTEHVTPRAAERLNIVHCGVDLRELPFVEGARDGSVLAVGRLDPIKGFEDLIEALGDLHDAGRDVPCQIIGEGPLEGDLRARIARRGVGESVKLVGAKPQSEVRAALNRASVFVLPSVVTEKGDRDGIPVSLMEAMAAGTTVVSTRVSGIPELVEDGREGLLVPEHRPSELAAAIAKLLDDPALAGRFARAAREKVEREFDATKEAHKLLDLFSHGST